MIIKKYPIFFLFCTFINFCMEESKNHHQKMTYIESVEELTPFIGCVVCYKDFHMFSECKFGYLKNGHCICKLTKKFCKTAWFTFGRSSLRVRHIRKATPQEINEIWQKIYHEKAGFVHFAIEENEALLKECIEKLGAKLVYQPKPLQTLCYQAMRGDDLKVNKTFVERICYNGILENMACRIIKDLPRCVKIQHAQTFVNAFIDKEVKKNVKKALNEHVLGSSRKIWLRLMVHWKVPDWYRKKMIQSLDDLSPEERNFFENDKISTNDKVDKMFEYCCDLPEGEKISIISDLLSSLMV